jgi:type IV pilus assembly protein PilB
LAASQNTNASQPNSATMPPPAPAYLARLVEQGQLASADLAMASLAAQRQGVSPEAVLVKQEKLTRQQLGETLAQTYGLRYVNVAEIPLEDSALALLPKDFMVDKQILPITNGGGRLVVAMVNPVERGTINEITFLTGLRPQILVTSVLDFQEVSGRVFTDSRATELFDKLAGSKRDSDSSGLQSSVEAFRQQSDADLSDTSSPVVQLVTTLLQEGIVQGASDVHMEPRQDHLGVRFRADGILKHIVNVPLSMEGAFVTRIKVMAKMDISDHRRPQDGRITLKFKGTDYNLRVNTLPVSEGREKIVIRILRPSKQISDFADLGFTPEEIKKLETLYKAPYGIVLVCGPTGSGKTTTLYTVLHKINDDIRNISTIEDPIELRIEGLNQSQVNSKADYTFASSLRALLRQDPDVLMVGEIRDHETLESAIHAALTGHLVFSTIHSNTTAATITRIREMGAEPNLIASALNGVIAQRLVRSLCKHCKEPYEASPTEAAILFPTRQPEKVTLMRAVGCHHCKNSGYSGRIGIYEIMMVDRELKQQISAGQTDLEIEDAATRLGMKTLGMNGRMKVMLGDTSFEEMVRVLGPTLSGS